VLCHDTSFGKVQILQDQQTGWTAIRPVLTGCCKQSCHCSDVVDAKCASPCMHETLS